MNAARPDIGPADPRPALFSLFTWQGRVYEIRAMHGTGLVGTLEHLAEPRCAGDICCLSFNEYNRLHLQPELCLSA